MTPFRNETPADFRNTKIREEFAKAIPQAEDILRRRQRKLKDATPAQAAAAVALARRIQPDWSRVSAAERASLLVRTAGILRRRRNDLAALVMLEVHKNRREADADACEAIDFLEYYAREAIRIAGEGPLEPLGLVAVIAPWNFPLAILTGMTSAALVAGNGVLLKPAEQSPVVAREFFDILREAGFPDGIVQFLPGPGETVGDFLVRSPDVDLVCFTGSKEVGMRIAGIRANRGRSPSGATIAEMGGKNAIIIDESADLRRAAEGTAVSAFGFQGQKCSACSRAIVLPGIYDEFRDRLIEAAKEHRVGNLMDPANDLGPVIDDEAYQKISRYVEIGKKRSTLLYEGNPPNPPFVFPTIFEDVPPSSPLAQEEIFGPVLALMKADDLARALEIANHVPFDLTGGLYSSLPAHVDRAKKGFEVGNLYINRKITGALVACQPFGGYRISSLGFKAGGPEYLYQFLKNPPMPEPPERRDLPRFVPDEANELVYAHEGERILSKTICESLPKTS